MIPNTAIPIGNEEMLAIFDNIFSCKNNNEENITNFEQSLSTYLNINEVFAFNSGRTALYVALKSLGLKKGSEVIVPAFTCAIVYEVILRLGLKPVFVDINPETYNIDVEKLSKSITPNCKVVIPIHLFGKPCEMDKIMDIVWEYDLYLIEDAAQALGAEYKGDKIGHFGDLSVFSFGPGKNITSGEGGALIVNNETLSEKVYEIQSKCPEPNALWGLHIKRNIISMKLFSNPRLYWFINNYLHKNLQKSDRDIIENCIKLLYKGDNTHLKSTIKLGKMPSYSAMIARIQINKIDEMNSKRIKNSYMLTDLLQDVSHKVILPINNDGENIKNIFTRYPIKLYKDIRYKDMKIFMKNGVDVDRPYYYLAHFLRVINKQPFQYAKDLCNTLITIPNHPCLEIHDIEKIASVTKNILMT